MREFFRKIRADFLLSSLLCIALGIVFIVWREATVKAVGTILAVIMIVIGAVYLCSFFLNAVTKGISAAIGAIVLLLGVWVFIQPEIIVSVIPIVIGVLLIGHGVRGVKESLDSRKYGCASWGVGAALAGISMVFGVICIVDAFGVLELASVVIGIALIYNGISNIWIAARATTAEKKYRKEHDAIDVEFKED